jgi:hypothetical protein
LRQGYDRQAQLAVPGSETFQPFKALGCRRAGGTSVRRNLLVISARC